MKDDIKVISARDRRELGPDNRVVMHSVYEYMIGELGPFTYLVPSSQDTVDAFKTELARRREILAAAGR